jgi:KDO2-lipid IV(A) lauroyltransferase
MLASPGGGRHHRRMRLAVTATRLLIRLGAWLPLRALHALGGGIGWLAGAVSTREHRVAHGNVARCFPELGRDARRALVRETLREAGRGLTELAAIWGRRPASTLRLIRSVEGVEHLDAGLARGRGVIVAAPHLGCWELLNLWLATRAPLSILYRAPVREVFEPLLVEARTRSGVEALRAEPAAVRKLVRRLAEGRMVGILPDQRARHGEGLPSTFFGQPTRTMTLLSRLAARTGAAVVIAWAERLPRGGGYAIHLAPASPEVASEDLDAAVHALDRDLEAAVRRAPAQYQWTYKRFGFWTSGMPAPVDD